jgi:competence protein ComEC
MQGSDVIFKNLIGRFLGHQVQLKAVMLLAQACRRQISRFLDTAWQILRKFRSADRIQISIFCGIVGVGFLTTLPSIIDLLWTFLVLVLLVFRMPKLRSMVVAAGLAVSFAVYQFNSHLEQSFPVALETKSVVVEGVVAGLTQHDASRLRFDFRIKSLVLADALEATSEWLSYANNMQDKLIRLSCYQCRLDIGTDQRWRFTVRLKRPHGYASWNAFDYEKYLFRHQIIATGYVREKEVNQFLGESSPTIHSWRASLRNELSSLFNRSDIGSGIIAALILGDKSQLTADQQKVFQAVGVSHLMAISGLHVGLVFLSTVFFAQLVLWPFAGLFNVVARQTLVMLPAMVAATSYAALAGFAVSTQRAIIMLGVYVVCRLLAREVNLYRVLMLAAVLILMVDPFSILDPGYWMSCGAVLVIAIVNQTNTKVSLIRLQPAIWLGMMPLTVMFFGQISLISPFVNLVMVPLFCVILIPATLLTLVIHQVGLETFSFKLFNILSEVFQMIYQSFEWLSQLPFALIYPQAAVLWQWAILGSVLLLSLVNLRWLWLASGLAWLWLWPSPNQLSEDDFTVTLLDVGQGLSMVVEAPDYVLVYDTGPAFTSGFTATQAVLLPFLRGRGIRKIDRLIISHADNDHIGGLPTIVSQMQISSILTSRVDRVAGGAECRAGQHWQVQGVVFSILGPETDTPEGSNNRSCVLAVENHSLRVLITGDIEKPVERFMLAFDPAVLDSDFMLVPHQGSKTSSTPDFIEAVSPRLALLAAGYRNRYGHPHDDVVNRYQQRSIDLLSTVDHGSIKLKIRGDEWSRTSYRKSKRRFWRQ